MNKALVSVESLTKSFSGRRGVDDLSFAVHKGEVFALLGHNGAGKSTTIDLILGLKKPDEGCTKILAKWMPLGIGIELLKLASLGCYDTIVVPGITLIAMAVICGSVAVKTFRWE